MTRRFLTVSLSILGLGIWTASAAQQPYQQEQEQERQQQEQQQTMHEQAERPFMLSDQIIGTDIQNPEGERISAIEQLVIERDTGELKYAIADLGGFLGLGAREVAVPWTELKRSGPDMYVLDRTAEELRQAPVFNEEEWIGIENLAEWEQDIEQFFGGETEPSERLATNPEDKESTEQATVGRLNRQLILSDHLIGTNIENEQNESLGEIEQFIVAQDGERVRFAVVDVGGVLGVGARTIAVPYDSLQFTGEEEIVLTGAVERLENAPVFDENEWSGLDDYDEWEREVNEFFGVEVTENR